ncbi:hypothetical protein EF912_35675 [Streptomyces sp. WAC07061]|uniref:hypothetical protein n=1 Tax=Streptomyces sp. WAC07061 TaxID=2487410 RepID=UPI000F791E24|nr:hypothetical protein [Streptomyces sp. WAC07061]RSS36169.1 hypothetical protein EF912_35675 [Streptomyces sp. WAC07061]
MKSYMVQVHLYGSVAVVTLCASPDLAGRAGSVEGLVRALGELGAGVASVVLDLDCAPDPAPAPVWDAVDAWAAGREAAVVVLAPAPGSGGGPGVPVLRTGPAGGGPSGAGGEAAVVRRLRRAVAGRALASQAAGIRRARNRAHPCSGRP